VTDKKTSILRPERVLLLFVLAAAFLALLPSSRLVGVPYQIDYGEGLMLDGAMRLRHSQPLYPDPFRFPVVLHVYGPVAYAAVALVLPAGAPSFIAGRVLVFGCAIALSFLIAWLLWRWTGSWWIGLSFGLLLLTLPAFRFWLYLLRADIIGVALSLAGVALYQRKPTWWSVPFFALAIFSKYTLVAAPLAVFAHLLVTRRVKEGAGFAAGMVGISLAGFAAMQRVTGGWFAFHMFATHPDRYSLTQFFALAGLVWASAPVVTALALWHAIRDFRNRTRTFPPLYLAISSLTALTAGKLGSTTNHFLEWMVAACLCAGLGYSVVISSHAGKAMPVTFLLGASVLVGAIVQNRQSLQPTEALTQCGPAYQYVARSTASRVFSENLGAVLMTGRPVLVSDPFVYLQLAKHGLRPDREVETLVNEKYFDLIVMSNDPATTKLQSGDIWPESLVDAVGRNYRPVEKFNCRDAGVMMEPVGPTDAHRLATKHAADAETCSAPVAYDSFFRFTSGSLTPSEAGSAMNLRP
jgi:hypothetical protein